MLAWPAFALLKQHYPEATVIALVPQYTSPMAELCPWVDEVMIDEHRTPAFSDILGLSRKIRSARVDASVSLFSETRTAVALWLARVAQRVGPATKLAQVFLNDRLRQRRSRSAKPEHEYNTDLVRYFIESNGDSPGEPPEPPYLSFDRRTTQLQKQDYYREHGIGEDHRLVYIHPGSGGSAINLSLQQYADLAAALAQDYKLHIVITAGPGELGTAQALSQLMRKPGHSIYHSTQGLLPFCQFIAMSDLFISGSTGPLHIAGALNVATAAFYPARQSATELRWQTLNDENRRIVFSPEKYTGDDDMKTIDTRNSARRISEFLQQVWCVDT